jgi:hypothetical protein
MRESAERRDGSGTGKAGNADAKTMNSEQWGMTENRSGGTKTGGHERIYRLCSNRWLVRRE